ncbi:hypothetical protein BH24BAC1_BH24BAC1_29300 [soil metagenome]
MGWEPERLLLYVTQYKLHRNPVTKVTVAEPAHYVFRSASNYAGQGGLLEMLWLEEDR